MAVNREALHQAIDEMTDADLEEFEILLLNQNYKKTYPGSAWFRTLYDLFAPVREAAAKSDMSEEELNQVLDEALEEVRRERDT